MSRRLLNKRERAVLKAANAYGYSFCIIQASADRGDRLNAVGWTAFIDSRRDAQSFSMVSITTALEMREVSL